MSMNRSGSETGAPVLEVRNLAKRFVIQRGLLGNPTSTVSAVEDVSFSVSHGETLGLVGESGCGKSTTGKTILKLTEPSAGSIHLNGRDITALRHRAMLPYRRQMQIIFQDPYSSINPKLTAGSYVGEPLIVHGIARRGRDKEERVAELFRLVGLRPDQMRRFPHEFSGGQRQRLAVARALALEPELIVADECVSALDVSIQAAVINLMEDLQKELGIAYLFIAHDIGVVEHISHRVAVMYLGRLAEIGHRETIFTSPQHPYTEALLSAVPVPNPRARGREKVILKGEVPSPINPPSGCRFHTRCPYAFDRCKAEIPQLREIAPGRMVACHLR